jgi:hypothetical protein
MVWVVAPSSAVAPLALAAAPLEKLRVGSTSARAVPPLAQGTERARAPSARLRKVLASSARPRVPERQRPARDQPLARCC